MLLCLNENYKTSEILIYLNRFHVFPNNKINALVMRNSCFQHQQNRVPKTLSIRLISKITKHSVAVATVLWLMEQTEVKFDQNRASVYHSCGAISNNAADRRWEKENDKKNCQSSKFGLVWVRHRFGWAECIDDRFSNLLQRRRYS